MNKKHIIILLTPLVTIAIILGLLFINKSPKNKINSIETNEIQDYEKELSQENIEVTDKIIAKNFKLIFNAAEQRYFLEIILENTGDEDISLENYYIKAYDNENNLIYKTKTEMLKKLEANKSDYISLEVDEKIANIKYLVIDKNED